MSKKKLFRFVNYEKEGKGVTKQQAAKEQENRYSFGGFFVNLKRSFSLLVMLNLVFLLTNIFLFSALLALTGNFDTTHLVPSNGLFQSLAGVSRFGITGETVSLWGIAGQLNAVGYPSVVTYILYGISILTVFTFGPTNAGMAYLLRGVVRGDYVDMGDYFRAIKNNFWQSFYVGILDLVTIAVFAYAIYFYSLQTAGGFGYLLIYYLALFAFLIYLMMRFFFYLLIVTFKLSLWKIIKNSYILTVAGIKRNIIALIGCAFLIVLNVVLFIFLPPLGAILPFIFLFSLCAYMAIFAAYPTVKKLMIDPYYPDEEESVEEEEAIFRDMG